MRIAVEIVDSRLPRGLVRVPLDDAGVEAHVVADVDPVDRHPRGREEPERCPGEALAHRGGLADELLPRRVDEIAVERPVGVVVGGVVEPAAELGSLGDRLAHPVVLRRQ